MAGQGAIGGSQDQLVVIELQATDIKGGDLLNQRADPRNGMDAVEPRPERCVVLEIIATIAAGHVGKLEDFAEADSP